LFSFELTVQHLPLFSFIAAQKPAHWSIACFVRETRPLTVITGEQAY
jgi:hypothetical protein